MGASSEFRLQPCLGARSAYQAMLSILFISSLGLSIRWTSQETETAPTNLQESSLGGLSGEGRADATGGWGADSGNQFNITKLRSCICISK